MKEITTVQSHGQIDPVTFEVVRHSLWNVNVEHGMTLARVSGSPIAVYAHDFNPALLTASGEWVYTGAFLQVLSAACESAVKWIIAHYAENPGINEGDFFLTNDPWIGAMHQQDVNILHPVFYEGGVFCWVGNSLHQYDLGGENPGSFCPNANDVFSESVPIPPIKIVEREVMRDDLERMYVRRSRLPKLVSLDLRAQIAACRSARLRILEVIARYGAETVQAVMTKITDDAERVFLQRMGLVPDGTWSELNYLQIAHRGDRSVYPVRLTAEKKGTELYFRNEGTHPQVGSLNNTVLGWRGGIMTAINQIFLFDQMCAIGGGLRHIHFDHTPGLITCADFPASVSCAPPTATLLTQGQALRCLSRMISGSAELWREANAPYAATQFPIVSFEGLDQRGDPAAGILLDPMTGGLGAFADHDGVDSAGFPPDPMSMAPNVEFNEQSIPMLYLYRRELMDSGGAGKYRGGNSCVQAFVLHDTERLLLSVTGSGVALPSSLGLWGGYPGCPTRYTMVEQSNVREMLKSGAIPGDVADISGQRYLLPTGQESIEMDKDCILEFWSSGSGGYGDPLERDKRQVREDLREGRISQRTAKLLYGLAVENAELDRPSSDGEEERLRVGASEAPVVPTVSMGNGRFKCQRCESSLGDAADYHVGAAVQEVTLTSVCPLALDPAQYVDDAPSLVRYACPTCGALLDIAFGPVGAQGPR
ncbi:MAG: hydantoinase B/oxoprolinase family protein [Candidatus Dormibacterales bacterium]